VFINDFAMIIYVSFGNKVLSIISMVIIGNMRLLSLNGNYPFSIFIRNDDISISRTMLDNCIIAAFLLILRNISGKSMLE
jgi:hypothetical protein